MKVTIEIRKDSWKQALNLARKTIGKEPLDKEPSENWKYKILKAEHSPIRAVEYIISFEGIKQWITTHLVRHWLGFIPFVHSQRDDRRQLDCSRDDLPQGALNDMSVLCNAQALINISRKRLCNNAHSETRKCWEQVKSEMSKIDPIMSKVMVRECIYRGHCPELNCCGYVNTEQYKNELFNYLNYKNDC